MMRRLIIGAITLGLCLLGHRAWADTAVSIKSDAEGFAVVVGGGVPDSSRYVQDGLVAQWDGIENASRGKHVAALPNGEWRDLIGGVPFAMHGVAVEGDRLVFSGANGSYGEMAAANADTFNSCNAVGTLEVVYFSNNAGNQMLLQGTTTAGISIGSYNNAAQIICWSAGAGKKFFNIPSGSSWNSVANTIAVTYSGSAPQNLYLNTIAASTASGTQYWGNPSSVVSIGRRNDTTMPLNGSIYAIRLYNRVLSADEIAANALIDQRRFPVPSSSAKATVKLAWGAEDYGEDIGAWPNSVSLGDEFSTAGSEARIPAELLAAIPDSSLVRAFVIQDDETVGFTGATLKRLGVFTPAGYTLLRAVRTKAEGVNANQIKAYIDTGYQPTSLDLGFDFDFAYHSALSPSNGKRIMGAGGKSNDKWSGLFLSGTTIAGTEGGGTFYFGKMSSPINPGLKQNERVLLRVRNHALKSSAGLDEALTATEQKFDDSSILLGRNGTALSDKVSTSADITIYGFKIYEGDTLVANFIPVQRDSDGEIGLLDIAGNQGFRGNAAGEGELAAVELSDAPPSLVITSSLGDGAAAQPGEVFPNYGLEEGLQAGEKMTIGLLRGDEGGSFCSGWKLYHQEGEAWVLDQVGSGPLEYVQGSVPAKLEWQWHQMVLEPSDEGTLTIASSLNEETGAPQPAYGSYSGFAEGDPVSARMEEPVVTNGVEVLSCVGWRLYRYSNALSDWEVAARGAGLSFTGNFESRRMKLEWVWLKLAFKYPQIPDGYTLLEYVESTGSQYLDTGIVPKSTTRLCVDFQYTNIPTPIAGDGFCNGWGASASQEAFEFGIRKDGKFFEVVNYKTEYTALSAADTNRHTLDLASGAQYFDGELKSETSIGDAATSGQTMYLFALHGEWYNTPGNANAYSSERIFSCQIWDGTKLVRDYVPAREESTGKVGFWDLAGNAFAPPTAGTLVAGPGLPPGEFKSAGSPGTLAVVAAPSEYGPVFPGYGVYDAPQGPIACGAPSKPSAGGVVVRCLGYRLSALTGEDWVEAESGEDAEFVLTPYEQPMKVEWLWEAHTETYHATIAGVQKLSEIVWLDANDQRVSWDTVRLSAAELQLSAGGAVTVDFDAPVELSRLSLAGGGYFRLVNTVLPSISEGVTLSGSTKYELVYPFAAGSSEQTLEMPTNAAAVVLKGPDGDQAAALSGALASAASKVVVEGHLRLENAVNDFGGGVEVRAGSVAEVAGQISGKLTVAKGARLVALGNDQLDSNAQMEIAGVLDLGTVSWRLPYSSLQVRQLFFRPGAVVMGAGDENGVSLVAADNVCLVCADGVADGIKEPVIWSANIRADGAETMLFVDDGHTLRFGGRLQAGAQVAKRSIIKNGTGRLDLAEGFAIDPKLEFSVANGTLGVSAPLTVPKLKMMAGGTVFSPAAILTVGVLEADVLDVDLAGYLAAKPWCKRFEILHLPEVASFAVEKVNFTPPSKGEWAAKFDAEARLLKIELPDLDTDWTGLGGDFAWTNALNWTRGVPRDGMYVTITNVAAGTSIALPADGTAFLARLTLSGGPVAFAGGTLRVDELIADKLTSALAVAENTEVVVSSRLSASAGLNLAEKALLVISNDLAMTFATAVGGAGEVLKEGEGTLTLVGPVSCAGGLTLAEGLTRLGAENAAGAKVSVAAGASLDLAGFGGVKELALAGAGDGLSRPWALTSSGASSAGVTNVVLRGDATVKTEEGTVIGFGGEAPGALDLLGHTLVKNGDGVLALTNLVIRGGTLEVREGGVEIAGDSAFAANGAMGSALVIREGAWVRGAAVRGGEAVPLMVGELVCEGEYRGAADGCGLWVTSRLAGAGVIDSLQLGEGATMVVGASPMVATNEFTAPQTYALDFGSIDLSTLAKGEEYPAALLAAPLPTDLAGISFSDDLPPLELYCTEDAATGVWTFGVRRKILPAVLTWVGQAGGTWTKRDFDGVGQIYDDAERQSIFFADSTNKTVEGIVVRAVGAKQVNALVFSNDFREVRLEGDAVSARRFVKTGAGRAVVAAEVVVAPGGEIALEDGVLVFEVPAETLRTVTARIVGAGAVELVGGGTLVLAGANSFSGGITVTDGVLRMGSKTALGASASAVRVLPGGTLDMNGQCGYAADEGYALVLAGGCLADFASSSVDPTNSRPFSVWRVTASSEVSGSAEVGLVAVEGGATAIELANGAVLNKRGENALRIANATVSGNGRVQVTGGSLTVDAASTLVDDVVLEVSASGRLVLNAELTMDEIFMNGSVAGQGTLVVRKRFNSSSTANIPYLSLASGALLSGIAPRIAGRLTLGDTLDLDCAKVPENGTTFARVPADTYLAETRATVRGQGSYRLYVSAGELKFFRPPVVDYEKLEVVQNFQEVRLTVKVRNLKYGPDVGGGAKAWAVIVDERGAERTGDGFELPTENGEKYYNFKGLAYGHLYHVETRLEYDGALFTLDACQPLVTANRVHNQPDWVGMDGIWMYENACSYEDTFFSSGEWRADPAAVKSVAGQIVVDPSEADEEELTTLFIPTNSIPECSGYEIVFQATPDGAYAPGDLPPADGVFGVALGRDAVRTEKLAFWVTVDGGWVQVPRSRYAPRLGATYEFEVATCLRGDMNGDRPAIAYYVSEVNGSTVGSRHFLYGSGMTTRRFPESIEFDGFMHLSFIRGDVLDDSLLKVEVNFADGGVVGQNFTNLNLNGIINLAELFPTDYTNGIAYLRVRDAAGRLVFNDEIWLSDTHRFNLPCEVKPGGIYSLELDVMTENGLRVKGDNDYRDSVADGRRAEFGATDRFGEPAGGWIREDALTLAGERAGTGEWRTEGTIDLLRTEFGRAEPCVDFAGEGGAKLAFVPTNDSVQVRNATTREFRFTVVQRGGDTPYRFQSDVEDRTGEELPTDLRMDGEFAGVTLVADERFPLVTTNLSENVVLTNYLTRLAVWDAPAARWRLVEDSTTRYARFLVTNRTDVLLYDTYEILVLVNYPNPQNDKTFVSYYRTLEGENQFLAGFELPDGMLPALGTVFTNDVSFAGVGTFLKLEGDCYDAHLAEVDGEEYWTIEEARLAAEEKGTGFKPLWNATYELTQESGRFSVIDPDGILKVLWNGRAYETEREGEVVWYYYSPVNNWIGFADDRHLVSNGLEYVVGDARALAWIARASTNADFRAARVVLSNRIDLTAHDWTPIARFDGVFDGQTNVITGLNTGDFRSGLTNAANVSAYALFASASNAVFQNVAFERVAITNGADAVAALLGCSLGELTVSNVTICSGVIRGDGTWTAGAVGLAEDYPKLVLVASTNAAALVAGEPASYLAGLVNLGGFTEYREGRGELKLVDNENRGELKAQIAIGAGNVAQVAGGAKEGATFGAREIHGNVGTGAVERVVCETGGDDHDLPPYPVVNLASVFARYGRYSESMGDYGFRRYIEAEGSPDLTSFDLLVDPCYRTARLLGAFDSNGETNLVGLVNDTITTLPDGGRFDLGFDLESWDPIEIDRNLGFNLNGHMLDVVFENSAFAMTHSDTAAVISNGTVIVNSQQEAPFMTIGEGVERALWTTNDIHLVKWGEDGTEYYYRDIYLPENDEYREFVSAPQLMTYLKTGAVVSFIYDSVYSVDEEGHVKVAGQTVATFGKGYKVVPFIGEDGYPACKVELEPIKLEDAAAEVALDLSEVLKSVGEIGPKGKNVELEVAGNTLAACDYCLQETTSLEAGWPEVKEADWKGVAKDGDPIRFTVHLTAEAGFFRITIREKPERNNVDE